MNVTARLEYELAYYDSAVHRFNHYTTKKGLVPYIPVRWGVHQIPQINLGQTPLQVSGSTSAGRVICGTDLAKCVSVPGDFLRPQGASPPGFYPLLMGGWVHRPAPEAPLTRGMPTGPRAFLANSGRVWATALRPVPPKKGLVPYMPVRWGVHQIPQINLDLNFSSCLVALRPAVLSAARIWPSVSRYLEISFGLRGLSPQAFTSFERVGFIARRLRRP